MVRPHLQSVYDHSMLAKHLSRDLREKVPLKLGIMSTISPDEIVDLVANIRARHPEVELRLCDANAKDLRARLLAGDLEVVIYAVFVLDKKTGNIENIWPISDLKNFVKDIDRKTGKLVERVELTMNKETLICPSTFGARSRNSGAYNPKTGLWYNDVLDFCGYLKPVEQKTDPKDYGTGHTGSNDFGRLVMAPDGRKPGKLSANDPLTGERKWSVDMDVPGFACVLTTGGGLVFNGDPMGKLQAHDADTGKVLWSFNTGSGMRGGIVSYAVDGEQYILVASGWGSYAALLMPALLPQLEKVPGASTLIAFKVSK